MNELVEVVYVGPKPVKKTHHQGHKYKFIRNVPRALESEVAYYFLQFEDIFCSPEHAEEKISAAVAAEKARSDEESKLAEAEKLKLSCKTYEVILDGKQTDISKYTLGKLRAVIESEDLDIDTIRQSAKVVRDAVRNSLHDKYGNPKA